MTYVPLVLTPADTGEVIRPQEPGFFHLLSHFTWCQRSSLLTSSPPAQLSSTGLCPPQPWLQALRLQQTASGLTEAPQRSSLRGNTSGCSPFQFRITKRWNKYRRYDLRCVLVFYYLYLSAACRVVHEALDQPKKQTESL